MGHEWMCLTAALVRSVCRVVRVLPSRVLGPDSLVSDARSKILEEDVVIGIGVRFIYCKQTNRSITVSKAHLPRPNDTTQQAQASCHSQRNCPIGLVSLAQSRPSPSSGCPRPLPADICSFVNPPPGPNFSSHPPQPWIGK